jgi:hypothetical protein
MSTVFKVGILSTGFLKCHTKYVFSFRNDGSQTGLLKATKQGWEA